MGNCIKAQSSKPWEEDDDDYFSDDFGDRRSEMKQLIDHWKHFNERGGAVANGVYRRVMEEKGHLQTGVVAKEVKIRVTKKQLEELVSVVDDIQGLSVQEVVKKLASFMESNTQHPHWKPALQSIPEVD